VHRAGRVRAAAVRPLGQRARERQRAVRARTYARSALLTRLTADLGTRIVVRTSAVSHKSPRMSQLQPFNAVISCLVAQLAFSGCILPPVTQQAELAGTEQPAEAASGDVGTTEPANVGARSAGVSATVDGAGGAISMKPPGVADAGRLPSATSSSTAGTRAPAGEMNSMNEAGQSGSVASAGRASAALAGRVSTATAGQSGAAGFGGPGAALGAACQAANECSSGFCAYGVCCSALCENECSRCAADGICRVLGTIELEDNPGKCSGDHTCSGGGCLVSNGYGCTKDRECASQLCDGLESTPSEGTTPSGRCASCSTPYDCKNELSCIRGVCLPE
jgi:hypothetical protein